MSIIFLSDDGSKVNSSWYY